MFSARTPTGNELPDSGKAPPMNDTPRILIISDSDIRGTTLADWRDMGTLNPADFDLAILEMTSLVFAAQGALASPVVNDWPRFFDQLNRVRERLIRLLASGGTVVALLPTGRVANAGSSYFDVGHVLPFEVTSDFASGTTLNFDNAGWAKYFARVAPWEFSLRVEETAPFNGRLPTWLGALSLTNADGMWADVTALATNRAGEMLGLAVEFHDPTRTIGPLFVVPNPADGDTKAAIELILEEVLGVVVALPAPDWAESVQLTGLVKIDDCIDLLNQQARQVEADIASLRVEREKLTRWLGLIYETGQPLQDLCEEAYMMLGATTRPSEVSDEFVVIHDGAEMLIEVKGVGKSASKAHVGQLLVDSTKHDPEFDRIGLVVNAWRDLPLEERDTSSKSWFPQNVVEQAMPAGMLLVRTDTLLEATIRVVNGADGQQILDKMFASAPGVWIL